MSRWIEVESLIDRSISVLCGGGNEEMAVLVEDIDSAPSIDIVHCGECKYCSKDRIKWSVKDEDGNWIDTKCNLCIRTKLEVNLDDFCSYGERKEGEQWSL